MKRFTILVMLIAMVSITFAQTHMYVWKNGVKTNYAISEVDSVTFGEETFDSSQGIGVFSVSEDKKITFSKGNLQYTQSTDTWSFASTQYELLGTENVTGGTVSSSSSHGDIKDGNALADKIDLFGWSGDYGIAKFGVSTSTNNGSYYNTFLDWGTNTIDNDTPNTWRTLTEREWKYLFQERHLEGDAYTKLYGIAQVAGVNGLILLPDNWICPDGITFNYGFEKNYNTEIYAEHQCLTIEQWSKMEEAGAVFLPAAGIREGAKVHAVYAAGGYWLSGVHPNNMDYTYNIYICANCRDNWSDETQRYYGYSVRLVKDIVNE